VKGLFGHRRGEGLDVRVWWKLGVGSEMRIRERLYDGVKIVGGAFGYGEDPVSVLGSLSVFFFFFRVGLCFLAKKCLKCSAMALMVFGSATPPAFCCF
jgi:uncharacterized membrane protein YjgN (DUF898 family)